jgi:peptidoglycan lytic transglycosylase G
MKKAIVLLLVLVIAVASAAYVLYGRVNQPFRGYSGADQLVDIPAGAGTHTIRQRLIDAGVIRDALTYRLALWRTGDARRLQAGEYRFDRPMTPIEVLGKIARGEVDLAQITFPEGLTIAEMATLYESNGFGSAASFVEASRDVSAVHAIDRAARDLEGYLFPDTYAVPRRTDAARLVRAMTDRFLQVLTPELRQTAEARGLSVRQLVTLASIVEKETARAEERPLVAAVYSNRLKMRMGLQCDPTVIYALLVAGRYDGNLRRDDLLFDSPYNTYRYAGLPPGPIAAPGKGALEAAARPADVNYIYFVSRNDGSHEFARTLDEHNRNVHRWQIQYFRDRRAGRAQ